MKKIINPTELSIEGNASCQLRCPTCPTTSGGYPPVIGNGYLKFNDFKKLLDENPQLSRVNLECRGELFLNPEIVPIIEYAYKLKLHLYCNSGVNLNDVSKEALEGLVKFRFRHLLCSIDAATPEIYKIYRVGGDFNKVIQNIRIINHYKKKYHSHFPELTWQFVVFGHNEHELPAAKQFARELNMKFVPKMSWDSEYSRIRNKEFVMEQTGWPVTTREEYEKIKNFNYMRSVCYALWTSPRVNWDGKILGCCWNSWAEFGGNAFKDGYVSSINSEKIKYAREMLLGTAKFRDDLPCSTCKLYLKNRENNNYLTSKEIFLHRTFWFRAARFVSQVFPSRLKNLLYVPAN